MHIIASAYLRAYNIVLVYNRGIYMTMTREEKACPKWCEEKEEAGNTAKICVAHQRACIYTQTLFLNIRSPYSSHCLENHK